MRSLSPVLVLLLACASPQPTHPVEGPSLDLPPAAEQAPPPLPEPPGASDLHAHGRLTARRHPPRGPGGERGLQPLGLGGERDGRVFVPSGYDAARPAPLILLLHGAGGSAERILRRFRDRAEKHGTILLVPDSRDRTWDIVVAHQFGDDVAFLDRALALAFDRWNIDPERVAIAGFSDGASYALSIGLGNGGLFRGVLAFSPGFAAPESVDGHPRVFVSHGTEDRVLEIAISQRMVPLLRRGGYDVRFVEFPDGHTMPDDVLDTAFSWLANP